MKKGLTEKELHTCAVQREATGQLVIHQLFSNSRTTLKDPWNSFLASSLLLGIADSDCFITAGHQPGSLAIIARRQYNKEEPLMQEL